MARLKVRLHGKTIYDMPLAEERAYVAGRKEDCDFVLEPSQGISREHFKVSYSDGAWHCEVVSRYGDVIHEGEKVQNFTLQDGTQFNVPPYEFEFSAASASALMELTGSIASNLPAVQGPEGQAFDGSDERTVIGAAPTMAFIKMMDAQNEAKELIRLEDGESWIAGRDPASQIHISDQRVSRRQFEIRKTGAGYVILDMSSVNGTLLNGNPISTSEPTILKSGDMISVLDNYLYFELHDPHFKSRLEMVSVAPVTTTSVQLVPQHNTSIEPSISYPTGLATLDSSGGMAPAPYQAPAYPAVAGPAYTPAPTGFDYKKNRPILIGGAIALIAVAFMFGNEEKAPPPKVAVVATPGSPQEIFAKLTLEQQALIKQRYKDAKNMYMQGKYELAMQEIGKITELVPEYEDTKEIARLAKEAIVIQDLQRKDAARLKAKQEMEEKVKTQVAICEKKINPDITAAELDECLSPIMALDPMNSNILALKAKVDSITAQREAKIAEKAAYEAKVAQMKHLYKKAESTQSAGDNFGAIDDYNKVIAAKLPDPHGLKKDAQRNIASIRQALGKKTSAYLSEADKYYQAQNLKMAIMALRQAQKMDPDNPDIRGKTDRYTAELKKQMMVLYQEGILEESFGNVEGAEAKLGAREKWKKILDLDIVDGEYYKKAYIKLKKYGAL